MKVSHIVPKDILNLIDNREFYMCLANIAIKDKDYLEFYRKQSDRGSFVLLDNGAAEADQMTLDIMWKIIEQVHPSEVILNDSLLNKDETLRLSRQALQYYLLKGYKGQFMFVPQGKNIDEWIECFKEFDNDYISTIGVSKFITSGWNDLRGRYKCIEQLRKLTDKPVHLLGCHYSIKELKEIENDFDNIRSNDSAIAYIYSLAKEEIDKVSRPDKEINFLQNELTDRQIKLLKKNIHIYDSLLWKDF